MPASSTKTAPEAGAPELRHFTERKSHNPSEAFSDVIGFPVGQHRDRGPSQSQLGHGPDAPKLGCGIVLNPELTPAGGSDGLNKQMSHTDAGEMSVRRNGIAWFGR